MITYFGKNRTRLPVNQNPNPTPPNVYPSATHYTAADVKEIGINSAIRMDTLFGLYRHLKTINDSHSK